MTAGQRRRVAMWRRRCGRARWGVCRQLMGELDPDGTWTGCAGTPETARMELTCDFGAPGLASRGGGHCATKPGSPCITADLVRGNVPVRSGSYFIEPWQPTAQERYIKKAHISMAVTAAAGAPGRRPRGERVGGGHPSSSRSPAGPPRTSGRRRRPHPSGSTPTGRWTDSRMPGEMPLIGSDGKVVKDGDGKPRMVRVRGVLEPSGPPVAPAHTPAHTRRPRPQQKR